MVGRWQNGGERSLTRPRRGQQPPSVSIPDRRGHGTGGPARGLLGNRAALGERARTGQRPTWFSLCVHQAEYIIIYITEKHPSDHHQGSVSIPR